MRWKIGCCLLVWSSVLCNFFRTRVGVGIMDYASLIPWYCFLPPESAICLPILELYNGASLFGFVDYVASVCTWVGVIVFAHVGFIATWRFVLSKSVICFLKFELYDSATSARLVLGVVLMCSYFSATILGHVSFEVFRHVMSSSTVM